jgi:deoxyribodipyrimidine photolyase-related protein
MTRRWLVVRRSARSALPGRAGAAGDDAGPYTAAFLERNETALRGNHRLAQSLRGLHRLTDLDALVELEKARGSHSP